MTHPPQRDTERVGCWLVRKTDGETLLFGSLYPTLGEHWDDATVTTATWEVVQ